jgi:hypothetical protein
LLVAPVRELVTDDRKCVRTDLGVAEKVDGTLYRLEKLV